MKRIISIGLIFLFILCLSSSNAYCESAMKKLGRGLSNAITAPFEIPEQISRTNMQDGPAAAMTYGTLKGLAMTGVRAIVGIYEVVTFPIPFPKGYSPILTDPEFFFEEKNW